VQSAWPPAFRTAVRHRAVLLTAAVQKLLAVDNRWSMVSNDDDPSTRRRHRAVSHDEAAVAGRRGVGHGTPACLARALPLGLLSDRSASAPGRARIVAARALPSSTLPPVPRRSLGTSRRGSDESGHRALPDHALLLTSDDSRERPRLQRGGPSRADHGWDSKGREVAHTVAPSGARPGGRRSLNVHPIVSLVVPFGVAACADVVATAVATPAWQLLPAVRGGVPLPPRCRPSVDGIGLPPLRLVVFRRVGGTDEARCRRVRAQAAIATTWSPRTRLCHRPCCHEG